MPAAGVVYSCASWLVTKGMENGEDRERLLSVLSNGTYMMCLMQATGGGEGIQERGLLVVFGGTKNLIRNKNGWFLTSMPIYIQDVAGEIV